MDGNIISDMIHEIIADVERAYWECALWSTTVDDGRSFGAAGYTLWDLDPTAWRTARADIVAFLTTIAEERPVDAWPLVAKNAGRFGQDFWLTRNGHGAGFWDGDWPDEIGTWLTEIARPYGEVYLYVDDSGRVVIS